MTEDAAVNVSFHALAIFDSFVCIRLRRVVMLFFLVPPEPARPVLVPRRTMALEVTVSSRLALLGSLDKVRDLLKGVPHAWAVTSTVTGSAGNPTLPPTACQWPNYSRLATVPARECGVNPTIYDGDELIIFVSSIHGGSIGTSIKDDVAMRAFG